jgi:hypothetical protein
MKAGKELGMVNPTSPLLEMHLQEILEECSHLLGYAALLQRAPRKSERIALEAQLYVSLTHLHNHVFPALQEWDRLEEANSDGEAELRPVSEKASTGKLAALERKGVIRRGSARLPQRFFREPLGGMRAGVLKALLEEREEGR